MSDDFSLSLLKLPIALGVVIALIVIVGALLRRYGPFAGAAPRRRTRDRRLSVQDALALDGKRRLLLVRRDNVDHLLLLGGPNDVVIENDIAVSDDEGEAAERPDTASTKSHPAQAKKSPAQKATLDSLDLSLAAETKDSAVKERHEPTL